MSVKIQPKYNSQIEGLRFASSAEPSSSQKAPAMVLMTVSIVSAAIQDKQSLVVTTPSKESFGYVVAALLALDDQLDALEEGRAFVGEDAIGFKPGDKLKLGDAVVEYVGPAPSTKGVMIRYHPKCPLTHTLTYQQALLLQKTDSNRRLSTDKKFSEELRELKRQTDLIGSLQREKTFSDSTIVVVGTLSRARAFFADTLVDNEELESLLLCAQINYDDDGIAHYEMLGAGQHTGIPSLASAYSLSDILELEEDDLEKIRAIIIDVDNYAAFIDRNIDDLRELRKRSVPMIAVAPNSGAEDAFSLRDEGFLIWRWNKRAFEQLEIQPASHASGTHGFFRNLDRKCLCCARGSVQLCFVKDERIDAIHANLSSAEELIDHGVADDDTEETCEELRWAFVRLLRITLPFNEMPSALAQDDFKAWKTTIEGRRGFVPSPLLDALGQAIELIEGLQESDINEKERVVHKTLRDNTPEGEATLVVRNELEAKEARRYWSRYAPDFNGLQLSILSYGKAKAMRSPVGGRLIIVGWLGRDRMAQLLNSGIAEIVQLVLYEGCETRWYLNQSRAWERAEIKTDDGERVLAMPGVSRVGNLAPRPEPPKGLEENQRCTVDEVEERRKQLAYARHEAKGDDLANTVEAIPVHYAGDLVSFCRENGTLTDVSDVIEGRGGSPKERRLCDEDGLHSGSFVLLKDADKEPIRQLADRLLGDDADRLRQTAGEWRGGIQKIKEEVEEEERSWPFDFGSDFITYEVCQRLIEHGLEKSYQAIERMVSDPDMIVPGRNVEEVAKSIRAIGRTACDGDLEVRAVEIAGAGIKIQSAHRQAGKQLGDELARTFPLYMDELDLSSPEDIWEPLEFEIEGIGAVTLCRIVEIDRERRILVPASRIGELFEE